MAVVDGAGIPDVVTGAGIPDVGGEAGVRTGVGVRAVWWETVGW